MGQKYLACKTSEVTEGQQKVVQLGVFSVGIFNISGQYKALLNVCPHKGAALCEGPQCGTSLSTDEYEFIYGKNNELVRCAWHGWEFDISTGECLADSNVRAKTFDVSVDGDDIYVQI